MPTERKLTGCLDANDSGATDSAGRICGFCTFNMILCGANDDSDFSAGVMCCACGGGQQAQTPSAAPTAASAGTSCTDSDSGATDPYGDSCSAYFGNLDWCGSYDDSDFSSFEMCCACAYADGDDVSSETPACLDTDNGATDPDGDSCEYYETDLGACGGYDDDDFDSAEMCCACGGGVATANPTVTPGPSPFPTVSEEPTLTLAPTLSEIYVSTYDEFSNAIWSTPTNSARQRVIKLVGDIAVEDMITIPPGPGEDTNIKVAGANATKRARITPASDAVFGATGGDRVFLKAGDPEENPYRK